MSKLTVAFKDIPLQSVELRHGEIGIGRDPSNAVCIDSLALAEFHATIKYTPEGYIIRQLHADFPIIINGRQVSHEHLKDGDQILVGKHQIYFVHEPLLQEPKPEPPPENVFRSFEGSFQVMNGKRIGTVIPLKQASTQIGKGPAGVVAVTKGNTGYTISPQDNEVLLTINGNPIRPGEDTPLESGDIVRINSSLLQFFQK